MGLMFAKYGLLGFACNIIMVSSSPSSIFFADEKSETE